MDPPQRSASFGSAARSLPPGDDDLAVLLRLAGQRREISGERTTWHRQLARGYWQQKVTSWRRRQQLWLGLAAAALLVLVISGGRLWQRLVPPSAAVDTAATRAGGADSGELAAGCGGEASLPEADSDSTTVASGISGAGGAATAPAVERGSLALDQQWLQTGSEERAALRLAGGHELRLDVDTRLRLVSDTELLLERGAVYVDSQQAVAGPGIRIRTALGAATDVGTQFEVRLTEGKLQVRVREGLVNVVRDGRTHAAPAGVALILDAAGTVERHSTPVYGPTWQWSMEIAPTFALEGRTLREFLDWVTRETGWRLRFSDPAVAIGATSVVLRGSVAGLSPVEALATVLPTSGLRYQIVGGVLTVEPIEPLTAARDVTSGAT